MTYSSMTWRMEKLKEVAAVKADSANLDKAELEKILKRYEQATKQVGEILCRILT